MIGYSGTYSTGFYNPEHTLREMQKAIDDLRRKQVEAQSQVQSRMTGDWDRMVPPPVDFHKELERVAREPMVKKPVDCGHKKIPKHLKAYYHQLVDYYCQQDEDVKHMRDVQFKKPCCIIKYVKGVDNICL